MPAKKSSGLSRKAGKAAKKKATKNRVKLKPRQVKLLEGLVEGKSMRSAALGAGYSANTANHASDLLDTVGMRAALANLLAPPEKIAQRINEGLDAMETKFFQFEGQVTDHRDVIAWSERRQYAELAARLKGLDPGMKIDGAQFNQQVNVIWVGVDALAEP
jgi:hypothetical protein